MRRLAILAMLAVGCGDGGETSGTMGTGGAPMTSGTGGTGGTGDTGGFGGTMAAGGMSGEGGAGGATIEQPTCAARTGIYVMSFSMISSTGPECAAISPVGIKTRAEVDFDGSMKILVGLGCTEVVTGDSCNTSTTYTCENTDGTPPRVWRFDIAWSEDGLEGHGKAYYSGLYPDHGGPCDLVLKVDYVKGRLL